MKELKAFGKGLDRADCFSTSDEPVEKKETEASGPRLVVDLSKEEVILDDATYKPGRKAVIVLDVLWKAEGQPMFYSQMRKAHLELQCEMHLDRVFKELKREWPTLGKIVEKTKNGHQLRKEYLK